MIDYIQRAVNSSTQNRTHFDEGLRSYMLKIYNYMALALVLTGLPNIYISYIFLLSTNVHLKCGRPSETTTFKGGEGDVVTVVYFILLLYCFMNTN